MIVTTKDACHDDYICRALELGCDAITEKPMTIDETKCRRILETQKKTGRNVRVTFNYRYAPPRTQVKDLLMKGTIGEVLSVAEEGGSHRVQIRAPKPLHRFIAPKGSITVEGVSLTVNEVADDVFGVNLILKGMHAF